MEMEAGPSSKPDNGKPLKRSGSESRDSAENNQQHRKRPRSCADEIVYRMRENRPSDATATSTGVDILLVDQRKGPDQSAAESDAAKTRSQISLSKEAGARGMQGQPNRPRAGQKTAKSRIWHAARKQSQAGP